MKPASLRTVTVSRWIWQEHRDSRDQLLEIIWGTYYLGGLTWLQGQFNSTEEHHFMPVSDLRVWDHKHKLICIPLKHLQWIQMGLEWREAGMMFQARSRKGTGGSTGWTRSRNSVCLEKKRFPCSRARGKKIEAMHPKFWRIWGTRTRTWALFCRRLEACGWSEQKIGRSSTQN